MSLDAPNKNKMMQAAPAKKEFFFAATAEYLAEVVYADTIAEAEAIYHSVRRLITPPSETISTSADSSTDEAVH